jgi:hypothetical protein
MDPKMTEVTQMFARFKAAYARNDLDACVTLLSQLKVRKPASLDLSRPPSTSRCFSLSRGSRGYCLWGLGVGFQADGMKDAILTRVSMVTRDNLLLWKNNCGLA